MRELAQTRELIEPIATARRRRGHPVTAEHVDRTARLLADLWGPPPATASPRPGRLDGAPAPRRLRRHHRCDPF